MEELFVNIPDYIKILSEFWVNLSLRQDDPVSGLQMLYDFAQSCPTEEERAYVDFYFNLRMEQLNNESDSN